MPDYYDVIIVGTGAGGGTLAHTLAPSDRRILLLERGDFLPREMQNWDPDAVFVDGRYVSPETWYDAAGKPLKPQVHYYVGGATKLYGAALYRLRPRDFGALHHVDGVSPAWPLHYDDFEPWYAKAEWLYQVHGNGGEDPTEGTRSRPYPWPAISHEPRIEQLFTDLAKGGYRPFHAPCGILLDEGHRARSTCIRCAWCDGYPCLVHAKSDAETIAVRPLLNRPNVSLLTGAKVTRLHTVPSGRRVSEVEVARDGAREVYRADIVVLSAGAANSAKILLQSACDRHPRGLANGSDQVVRRVRHTLRHLRNHERQLVTAGADPLRGRIHRASLAGADRLLGRGHRRPTAIHRGAALATHPVHLPPAADRARRHLPRGVHPV